MPMKKQVILCPNCASPIHLLNHGVECQYCGKGISGYDEDLSTFLEGALEDAYKKDDLFSMWEDC